MKEKKIKAKRKAEKERCEKEKKSMKNERDRKKYIKKGRNLCDFWFIFSPLPNWPVVLSPSFFYKNINANWTQMQMTAARTRVRFRFLCQYVNRPTHNCLTYSLMRLVSFKNSPHPTLDTQFPVITEVVFDGYCSDIVAPLLLSLP